MMELDDYLQKHYTQKTSKAYKREIEIYLSNNPKANKYSHSDIVKQIGTLRQRYSKPKTLNRILCGIKAWYNYLAYKGIRKDNPARSIRLRDKQSGDIQLQDLFTTQELEALLTAKKERYANLDYRNKVLITLLIYQALTPTEVEALEVEDIDLEAASIYIKPQARGHGRTLGLKANQIMLFKQYIEENRIKLGVSSEVKAFLIGQRKTPMTASDITKHIKRNYNIYRPRIVNVMTIRQSVITNLLKQNHDLRIVQSFAGHKNPSTTERYKQTNLEALKTAIENYHPIK
jgi:integrase/recombinase XerD